MIMKNHFKQLFVSHWINDERGAAAIIVTIIMLAVATLVVGTTALIGLDDLDMGHGSSLSNQTVLAAQSCMEEAMIRLSRDPSYVGGTVDVGESQCTLAVTGVPCGSCQIDAVATTQFYTRHLQADISIIGSVVDVLAWREVE